MPRIRLTKNAIDALPTSKSDVVYWDAGYPGFGVKVTPKGRKVFIVLYRTGGAGSKLRKYTIGPYGRVTLHQARVAAQKVFAARLEGRDPAAEKREAKRRIVADRVEDLLETFIAQRLSQNRSGGEIARLLRREVGKTWGGRSIHEIRSCTHKARPARLMSAVPLVAAQNQTSREVREGPNPDIAGARSDPRWLRPSGRFIRTSTAPGRCLSALPNVQ